jgi:RNA polymerase primary sigma factor
MRKFVITKELTNRNQISVDKYLSDISRIELLSLPAEQELCKQIKEGDETALQKLVLANLRFVVSVAKKYQHQGLSFSDLINEGNLGLMEAAIRFDETKGFKFITYAVWWIRQSIMVALNNHSRVIRLPASQINTISKLNNSVNVLKQKLNREPDINEVSEEVMLDSRKTTEILQNMENHISLDEPVEGGEFEFSLDYNYQTDDLPPDGSLMRESIIFEINRALKKLENRESEVIKMHFGLDSGLPMSLQVIGDKLFLSEERVRQIRNSAIRKLKSPDISKSLHRLVAS